jgi:hypothetical protein
MGKVTRAVFDASTATVFADNTNEDISEGDFRTKFDDVSASAAFLEDVNTFSKQQRWKKGADVASATVLPLIEDGNYFDVTGTVTVTSFADLGGAGTVIILQFDAACILTHHVTNLILPTGGNITTAAGDHAIFVNYASGDYRCVNYQRKDGTALVGGDVTKVGTPVNNQVGVWTSDGNLEGDSKLTFDGTTLGVTGGATFSGILTLGSTISNGTYAYTLPSATGTLALTSDVTTAVANLVDTAPSTLDTLNELAAALGDDPNFATTVTNSIATKLPLAGGTLTGTLNGTSASFAGSVTITGSNALRGSYGSGGLASNFAAGDLALNNNTTGSSNTAIGAGALTSNTVGAANTATGNTALTMNTTGDYNTATGDNALEVNTTGSFNTASGFEALKDNTVGAANTAIGSSALVNNTSGYGNTANGYRSLFDNTTGGYNTANGYNTGLGITTGSGNTVLGANVTGLAAGLTNNIILANGTGAIKAQHDGTDWALTGAATFSGNVGIGATPSAWSDFKVLEFANGVYLGTYTGGGQTMYLGANNYFNGTDYIYKVSAYATRYQQASGVHAWYTSTISGTEGNVASFNQSMALTAAGRLLINTPTESTYQLDVNGTGRFSSTLRVTNSGTNTLIWAQGGADGSGQGKGNIRSSDQSGANYWDFGRDNLTTGDFVITEYGGSPILRLRSSTGAATFSSSVTAQSLITSYSLDGDPALATFTNANAGTSAEATIYVRNGTTSNDATFIQALGTGFTTTGGFVQDAGIIGTGTDLSGGMSLMVRANADMRFYTNGHTNERMRITSDGVLQAKYGISFPNQSAGSGTVSSSTLDAYEEGTWTPRLNQGGADVTPSQAIGTYTRVGNLLHIGFYFYSNTPNSLSGSWVVKGLPYNLKSNQTNAYPFINFGYNSINGAVYTTGRGQVNTTSALDVYASWYNTSFTTASLEVSGSGTLLIA